MKLSFSLSSSLTPSAKFFQGQALWFMWNVNSSDGLISKKPSLTLRLNELNAFSCSLLYSQQYFEHIFKINLLHIPVSLGKALISRLTYPKGKVQGQGLYWNTVLLQGDGGINFNMIKEYRRPFLLCVAFGLCLISSL